MGLRASVPVAQAFQYLWENKILFKYAEHVKQASERLKQESLQAFQHPQLPVVFLRSPQVNKDELARKVAAEKGIHTGPVCALSSLEPSPTFEHRGTPGISVTDRESSVAIDALRRRGGITRCRL